MPDDPIPYELPDERVRQAWGRLLGDYLRTETLEPGLARRLIAEGTRTFAELGSSTAPISRLLSHDGVTCVAVDLTPPPEPFQATVRADLRAVPLRAGSFDAVAAVNCLYFLGDPTMGVREARRLLRTGGVFLAGAPSRHHDPELRHVLPTWGERSPFDAEEAAAIVGREFGEVEAEWWEAPAYHLPDRAAVVDYLMAFKVPDAEARAARVATPTDVTKSGVNIWARKT